MALSAFIARYDDSRGALRRLGSAGQSFAQQNFDPRFPSLSIDRARDFDQSANAAQAALTAPAGSIAARNNPFQYGSVASRQNPGVFGPEGVRGFDALQQSMQGMTRRSPFGGYDDGYGS